MATQVGEGLRLDRDLAEAIVAHALREAPIEACGVLVGELGTNVPSRHVPLTNMAASKVFYELSSRDLLALYRDLDDRGEEILVVYHSHTASAAYPSATDVALASEPGAHYVLVSTPEVTSLTASWRPGADFRAFHIVDGQITEESVELL